ncbi:MAG: DUF4368 domain-containing protein, partial [Firmicutes bacterium]|nr:DUF4368 domain-containing protein [Bacillota bacterium]
KLQERISVNNKEIERTDFLLAELYEDYKSGLLDKNDFVIIKKDYETKRNAALNAIGHINDEIEKGKQNKADNSLFIEEYKKYRNISFLTRSIAVYLIYRINVYEDDVLEIKFNGENQIKGIFARAEMIKRSEKLSERRVN